MSGCECCPYRSVRVYLTFFAQATRAVAIQRWRDVALETYPLPDMEIPLVYSFDSDAAFSRVLARQASLATAGGAPLSLAYRTLLPYQVPPTTAHSARAREEGFLLLNGFSSCGLGHQLEQPLLGWHQALFEPARSALPLPD